MDKKNLLFGLVLFIISVSLFNIFLNIFNVSNNYITGFASGYVNITYETVVNINLTRDSINWGYGTINAGQNNATLFTNANNDGSVLRGNWSGIGVYGLIVENIGNVNCSLFIQTNKNAHDFFLSSTTSNEEYKFNVSNKEVNSCSGDLNLGEWYDANKSSGGTKFCNQFNYYKDSNEIYIDLLLTVPYDATNIGEQSDIITLIANSA